MYLNDKTNRITLRLNDNQFVFVQQSADMLGVSPSEFLRMVINSTMAMSLVSREDGDCRENKKTYFNDKL